MSPLNHPKGSPKNAVTKRKLHPDVQKATQKRVDELCKDPLHISVFEGERNGGLYRKLVGADVAGKLPNFRRQYNTQASIHAPWFESETLVVHRPDKGFSDPRKTFDQKKQQLIAQLAPLTTVHEREIALAEQIVEMYGKNGEGIFGDDNTVNHENLRSLNELCSQLKDVFIGCRLSDSTEFQNFAGQILDLERDLGGIAEIDIEGENDDMGGSFRSPDEDCGYEDIDDIIDAIITENSESDDYKFESNREGMYEHRISDGRQLLEEPFLAFSYEVKSVQTECCTVATIMHELDIVFDLDRRGQLVDGIGLQDHIDDFDGKDKGTYVQIASDLDALYDDFGDAKKVGSKIKGAKKLAYTMKMSEKPVEDVTFGKDAGCCVAPENTGTGYGIPHYIADNGTIIFNINQAINDNSTIRRVGMILGFETEDQKTGERVLLCNSLELSGLMNPTEACDELVTYVEDQLGAFAKQEGYDRVEMVYSSYNTSVSHRRENPKTHEVNLIKKGHDGKKHAFHSDITFKDNGSVVQEVCFTIYPKK